MRRAPATLEVALRDVVAPSATFEGAIPVTGGRGCHPTHLRARRLSGRPCARRRGRRGRSEGAERRLRAGSGFSAAARGKPAAVWCSPPPQGANRRRFGVLRHREWQTGGGLVFSAAARGKPAVDRCSTPPQGANRRRFGVLRRRKGQTGGGLVFSAAARGKPAPVWCSAPPQGANRRHCGALLDSGAERILGQQILCAPLAPPASLAIACHSSSSQE